MKNIFKLKKINNTKFIFLQISTNSTIAYTSPTKKERKKKN